VRILCACNYKGNACRFLFRCSNKVFDERHKEGGVSILSSNHVVNWIGFIGVSRDDGKNIIRLSKIPCDRNGRNSTGQRTSLDRIQERVFVDEMLLDKEVQTRMIFEETHLQSEVGEFQDLFWTEFIQRD
jgi:hypothetical protein